MVGLPARGKSYISKALIRYLRFIGCPAKIFNAGNKRRDDGKAGASASFFDPNNKDAAALKEQMAMETLDELLLWLRTETAGGAHEGEGGSCRRHSMLPTGCACGIFDATNTTAARRKRVEERCAREAPPVRLIFVESICDDEVLLQHNYRMKLSNDDYKDAADADKALSDFIDRVRQYEKVYQQVDPSEGFRFIQMLNAGASMIVAGCDGYIESRMLSLLHSIHLEPRAVWLLLCGQTLHDVEGVMGGDALLSADGLAYSRAAAAALAAREGARGATLLTGTLRRYAQVVEMLRPSLRPSSTSQLAKLNDLCAGSLEQLPVAALYTTHRAEREARVRDKLNYRFPGVGGESYQDVIQRLLDVILTIEQTKASVVVVCDRVVHRILTAYLTGVDAAAIPTLETQRGVLELRRSHAGWTRTQLDVADGSARTRGPWGAQKTG